MRTAQDKLLDLLGRGRSLDQIHAVAVAIGDAELVRLVDEKKAESVW